MTRHRTLRTMLAALLLALAAPVGAELLEHTLTVPLALPDAPDGVHTRTLLLTVLRDSARVRAPYALLLHGRPVQADGFARMGRVNYPANAAWLVAHGFTVLVPTRIGYGLSAGPDLEYTGDCASKDYPRGVAAAVREMRALLAYAGRLPYVDARHGAQGLSPGAKVDGEAARVQREFRASGVDHGRLASGETPNGCAVAGSLR